MLGDAGGAGRRCRGRLEIEHLKDLVQILYLLLGLVGVMPKHLLDLSRLGSARKSTQRRKRVVFHGESGPQLEVQQVLSRVDRLGSHGWLLPVVGVRFSTNERLEVMPSAADATSRRSQQEKDDADD